MSKNRRELSKAIPKKPFNLHRHLCGLATAPTIPDLSTFSKMDTIAHFHEIFKVTQASDPKGKGKRKVVGQLFKDETNKVWGQKKGG